MKTYKIFASPLGSNEAVKQGWSWPGFFFNIIWAFVKKMWVLGSSLIVFFVILGVVEGVMEASYGAGAAAGMSAISSILNLIVSVIFGVSGNQWREKNLLSRGYEYKDTVEAENPEAGLALWVKGRKGTETVNQIV